MTSRTKGNFVRLFGRPQVDRRYDRYCLWRSTNSIISICTASSKSTKNFGRCRVFSYFQYIILRVTGYIWKCPMDDTIPMIESLEMHENTLRIIWFLWQSHRLCMKVPCGWYDSCDRVTGYVWKYLMDDTIPMTESRESNIMWIKIYWLPTHTLWWSTMFMCSKEILRNSLPTHLQSIIQPDGCWQPTCLPHRFNPSSTSDNLPLLYRVSNWRDWID